MGFGADWTDWTYTFELKQLPLRWRDAKIFCATREVLFDEYYVHNFYSFHNIALSFRTKFEVDLVNLLKGVYQIIKCVFHVASR